MSRYRKDIAAREDIGDRTPAKPRNLCCCPGCPLLGTRTESRTGSDCWYCYIHDGADHTKHAAITAMINNRRKLVSLMHESARIAVRRPHEWAQVASNYEQDAAGYGCEIAHGLSAELFSMTIRRKIYAECRQ